MNKHITNAIIFVTMMIFYGQLKNPKNVQIELLRKEKIAKPVFSLEVRLTRFDIEDDVAIYLTTTVALLLALLVERSE